MTAADGGSAASALSDSGVGPRVVRGGMQRAAGFVVANLLSAAGAVLLLRYLGVDEFGRYGTVMALVNIVYGISDAGLTITGSRELAVRDDDEARRRLVGVLTTIRVALTAGGVLVAVGFALLAGYDGRLVLGTALAGVGILLASLQTALLLPLLVELRNGPIALIEVLRQALLVASWAVLAAAGAGLVPFFAVQIAVGIVLLALTPVLLERRHFSLPRFDRGEMTGLMRVALPVAVANVLGVIYLRVLVILMSLLSSDPTQVGYYVTSTRVIELVGGLPFLLVSVVLPVVTVAARDDHDRMRYITDRLTEMMSLGGVLVALVLAVGADPIIRVLGGEQYAGAAPVLRIQAFALVTIFITSAWNPALVGMGRVRSLMATTGSGVIAVVIAGLALIGPFEAEGAAVAAVIADLVLCVATYIAVTRSGPARGLSLRPVARAIALAVPAVAVGVIPGVPDAVGTVLAAAVFLGGALLTRSVPAELLGVLRRGSAGTGA